MNRLSWILSLTVLSCARVSTEKPTLVVVLSIDQARPEYLWRFDPWFGDRGFRRLTREGALFSMCLYPHSFTETAPGHASIATGAPPSVHGIVANEWYDRGLGRERYAVWDSTASIIGIPTAGGVSPRSLVGSTIGDELKLSTYGKAKVFAVSNKDRSAVLMGGHYPDAAYWINEKQGRFVTSTYYQDDYPQWVKKYQETVPLSAWLNTSWTRALDSVAYPPVDTLIYEHHSDVTWSDRTFPHTLRSYQQVNRSPYGIKALFDFAQTLIVEEKLGQDQTSDLLMLSISSSDYVGHYFGAQSDEFLDTWIRMDGYLAEFLDHLDETIGLSNILVVLTADHGASPFPEYKKPPLGRRVSQSFIARHVDSLMIKRYGSLRSERSFCSWARDGRLYLNYKALAEKKIDKEQVIDYISAALEDEVPGVYRVYAGRWSEQIHSPGDEVYERVQRSFFVGRSPDLLVVLQPFHLWDNDAKGTDHFQPWTHDTQVPLILRGPKWIRPVRVDDKCSPLDIVPTISSILECGLPSGAQGRVLTEVVIH